ncbi:hypothetical protein V493_02379 [Pseudogymnoascus sp. VKM F-4281 (FW-2241)]|nr:hypothetical protein V493_02379 [Pseudogymnoascus sp. VKM F-4281 (FW-2241)]
MAGYFPTLRWGILGCGLISSWFVSDIVLARPSKPTHHLVQAIGSSSLAKAEKFKAAHSVWTRFFPITSALQKLLHQDKVIGAVSRVFVDFGLNMPIASLPPTARTADPALGAGALLDIGIYSLTWAALILDHHPDNAYQTPKIVSSMSTVGGADEMTSMILNYEALHAQAICTASMCFKTREEFCRVEGTGGSTGEEERRVDFETVGWGFWYEQDAVAEALAAGRKECGVMPVEETVRMMRVMDGVREANGLRYKQDEKVGLK